MPGDTRLSLLCGFRLWILVTDDLCLQYRHMVCYFLVDEWHDLLHVLLAGLQHEGAARTSYVARHVHGSL